MKQLLKEQGVNVVDKSFGCSGGFLILNSKHPNDKDLAYAKDFANAVISEIKNTKF